MDQVKKKLNWPGVLWIHIWVDSDRPWPLLAKVSPHCINSRRALTRFGSLDVERALPRGWPWAGEQTLGVSSGRPVDRGHPGVAGKLGLGPPLRSLSPPRSPRLAGAGCDSGASPALAESYAERRAAPKPAPKTRDAARICSSPGCSCFRGPVRMTPPLGRKPWANPCINLVQDLPRRKTPERRAETRAPKALNGRVARDLAGSGLTWLGLGRAPEPTEHLRLNPARTQISTFSEGKRRGVLPEVRALRGQRNFGLLKPRLSLCGVSDSDTPMPQPGPGTPNTDGVRGQSDNE